MSSLPPGWKKIESRNYRGCYYYLTPSGTASWLLPGQTFEDLPRSIQSLYRRDYTNDYGLAMKLNGFARSNGDKKNYNKDYNISNENSPTRSQDGLELSKLSSYNLHPKVSSKKIRNQNTFVSLKQQDYVPHYLPRPVRMYPPEERQLALPFRSNSTYREDYINFFPGKSHYSKYDKISSRYSTFNSGAEGSCDLDGCHHQRYSRRSISTSTNNKYGIEEVLDDKKEDNNFNFRENNKYDTRYSSKGGCSTPLVPINPHSIDVIKASNKARTLYNAEKESIQNLRSSHSRCCESSCCNNIDYNNSRKCRCRCHRQQRIFNHLNTSTVPPPFIAATDSYNPSVALPYRFKPKDFGIFDDKDKRNEVPFTGISDYRANYIDFTPRRLPNSRKTDEQQADGLEYHDKRDGDKNFASVSSAVNAPNSLYRSDFTEKSPYLNTKAQKAVIQGRNLNIPSNYESRTDKEYSYKYPYEPVDILAPVPMKNFHDKVRRVEYKCVDRMKKTNEISGGY